MRMYKIHTIAHLNIKTHKNNDTEGLGYLHTH